MKKIISLLVITILFIPVVVNAAQCDTSKVYIDSITIDKEKGNVLELEDATAKDKKVNLNLRMSTKDDEILYKVVLKNESNEDYEINKNSININSDYLEYSLESDNNNIIKANSSRTINLRVKYKTEVDPSKFVNGVYQDNVTMKVNLRSDDTPSNPNTGLPYIIIISSILLLSGITLIIYKKKKLSTLMILIGLILLPVGVNALCTCEIIVDSKVVIKTEDEFRIVSYGCANESRDDTYKYRIGTSLNEFTDSSYFSELDPVLQLDFRSMLESIEYDRYFVDEDFFECKENIVYPKENDYQNYSEYLQALEEAKNSCYNEHGTKISTTDKIISKNKGTYVFTFKGLC